MRLGRLVPLFVLILAVVVGFAALVVQAQSSKVHFMNESLKLMTHGAGQGMRVTFTFSVKNDGATIKQVLIRVLEPCNSKGEGRILVDLPNQVVGRGVSNYEVSGIFQAPSGDKNFMMIQLFDRRTKASPAPVLAQSAPRQFVPMTFKLAKLAPSS